MPRLSLHQFQTTLLEPFDLQLNVGDCITLSGPSGCGKSQLFRAIADLHPHNGDMRLDGHPSTEIPAPLWRSRVGLLPTESGWWADQVGQHFNLEKPVGHSHTAQALGPSVSAKKAHTGNRATSFFITLFEAISYALRARPTDLSRFHETDPSLLSKLGFAPEVLDWSVERLSSGERQRLALARLLHNRPEVLLLDEPTANLDHNNSLRVEQVIADYQASCSCAILWITHDPDQQRRVGKQHLQISDGHLIWS